LLFATEAVIPGIGVSDECRGKVLRKIRLLHRVLASSFWKYKLGAHVKTLLP
jgi:hypothetical protein